MHLRSEAPIVGVEGRCANCRLINSFENIQYIEYGSQETDRLSMARVILLLPPRQCCPSPFLSSKNAIKLSHWLSEAEAGQAVTTEWVVLESQAGL